MLLRGYSIFYQELKGKESWPIGPGFGLPLKGALLSCKPDKLEVPKMS